MTPPPGAPAEPTCASCGRRIEARRSHRGVQGDGPRFCSKACRARRVRPIDEALERAILDLLAARAGGASICPSEAARAVAPDDWRPLMEPARRAARRLVARGLTEMTQGGRRVDPSTAKGPVRVRRRV